MGLDLHGSQYNAVYYPAVRDACAPPEVKKREDNGIVMESGCFSECVSGPSISCTAHTSVMDAQRLLTHGSKPVLYYSSDGCIGIYAAYDSAVFF